MIRKKGFIKLKHLFLHTHTSQGKAFSFLSGFRRLVELSGIEPLTSCVQGRRSPS